MYCSRRANLSKQQSLPLYPGKCLEVSWAVCLPDTGLSILFLDSVSTVPASSMNLSFRPSNSYSTFYSFYCHLPICLEFLDVILPLDWTWLQPSPRSFSPFCFCKYPLLCLSCDKNVHCSILQVVAAISCCLSILSKMFCTMECVFCVAKFPIVSRFFLPVITEEL